MSLMRLFEILLLLADLLSLLYFIVPLFGAWHWLGYLNILPMVLVFSQIMFEGSRWQMIPAYTLAVSLLFVWLLGMMLPSKIRTRRPVRVARGIGMGLGVLVWVIAIVLPWLLPVFSFPAPDGPYQVGTVTYHWTEDRQEIFDSNSAAHRQLMAQVWYPVKGDTSSTRASYVQDASALSTTLGRSAHLPGFMLDHLAQVRTNAIPSAPVAHRAGGYPVLVFLTGVVGYRQSNTDQIEHLVSHGYVVVGIDQPYAAAAVTLPDGQVIPGWTRDQMQPLINQSLKPMQPAPSVNGHTLQDGIIPYLSNDVAFTLNQLAVINKHDPDGILSGNLDLQHIGAFGVSLGAMVTGQACHADQRIKACLMMDAAMPADVVQSGLSQPAMWLTRPATDMQQEKWTTSDINLTIGSMRAVYNKEPGNNGYYVQIPGMFHVNFTDGPLYSPVAYWLGFSGPIGTKGFVVIDDYSLAFFDHSLYGRSAPLLNGPAKQYPAVSFEKR